jgi:hypothetical protein
MDDICIFAESKEELHRLQKEVNEYLSINLHLQIKGNWQVFPTFTRGLDFVGYRFFRGYILLRKSTCLQFKRKMNRIMKKTKCGNSMNHSEWCAINSYKGWLIHCDGYRLTLKYLVPVQSFADDYYLKNIKRKVKRKS